MTQLRIKSMLKYQLNVLGVVLLIFSISSQISISDNYIRKLEYGRVQLIHRMNSIQNNYNRFGYSPQANIYMLGIALSKEIYANVKVIDIIIVDHFRSIEANQYLDMHELEDTFYDSHFAINEIIKTSKALDTVNIDIFINKLNDTINELNVPIPSSILQNLDIYRNFFNFLQTVSATKTSIHSVQFTDGLEVSKIFLDNLSRFYGFLPKIYAALSSYEYQNNKEKYNVANLNDWGVAGKQQGIQINYWNWKLFISLTGYIEMLDQKLNDIQLERLNTILKWTLRSMVEVNCGINNGILMVTGEIVLLSDVTSSSCYAYSKYIRVYAINSIIFDDVIEKIDKQVHLSIIAPTWNILSASSEIVLSGDDGTTDTERYGSGNDGKPGGPGGNSGHFFGIGSEFINGNKLKIMLNGGNGGDGQNGANGYKVNTYLLPPTGLVDDDNCDGRLWNINYWKRDVIFVTSALPKWLEGFFGILGNTRYYMQQYKLYGNCGGNGGHSGNGGIGGKSGVLDIIELKGGNSTVNIEAIDGQNGNCGVVGQAGKHSDVTSTTCVVARSYFTILGIPVKMLEHNKFGDSTHSSTEYHRFCNALNSGANCEGTVGQITSNPMEPLDRSTPVEQFRNYFTSNINDGLRKESLKKILKSYNIRTADIMTKTQ